MKHLAFWKNSNNYSSCFSYMRIYFNEPSGVIKPFPLFTPKFSVLLTYFQQKIASLKPAPTQKNPTDPTAMSPFSEFHPGGLTHQWLLGSAGGKARNQSGENRKSGRDEFMVTVPRNFSKWLGEWWMEVAGERWWVRCGWVGWIGCCGCCGCCGMIILW